MGLSSPNRNTTASAAQRCLALLLPLLLLPRPAPAQAARWVLAGTIVNPTDAPTELVVGVTPDYYESPRFDGTYQRYTVSPTVLAANARSVERDFGYWDVTISFTIESPRCLPPARPSRWGRLDSPSRAWLIHRRLGYAIAHKIDARRITAADCGSG